MAHTKAKGSTKLGRDSQPKYLGVKLSGGQMAMIGNIIVRQRGSKMIAGQGVRMGKDDTLYAVKKGTIVFSTKKKTLFNGSKRTIKVISIV